MIELFSTQIAAAFVGIVFVQMSATGCKARSSAQGELHIANGGIVESTSIGILYFERKDADDKHYSNTCTATLICKNLLLTARHCSMYAARTDLITSYFSIGKVRYDLNPEQIVSDTGDSHAFDVGIIGIAPSKAQDKFPEILAKDSYALQLESTELPAGKLAVYGYGEFMGAKLDWRLRRGVMANATLKKSEDGAKEDPPIISMTLGDLNQSACSGDSGGPVVYNQSIVGIISQSILKPVSKSVAASPCDRSIGVTAVPLAYHRDFVRSNISKFCM